MLSDIKGIKFKGAAFNLETTLQLFSKEEATRASIIFGRNGSGKSTVSRAISKAAGNDEAEDIVSAQFVDSNKSVATITDDEKKKVFVFNEDYTNKKVRLREDGLSTIVMFGELVDIEDKIKKATTDFETAGKQHTEQAKKYEPYIISTNILSPDNHYEKVKNGLKGDKNWAGREREILGNKSNSAVTDSIIDEIMKTTLIELQNDDGSTRTKTQTDVQINFDSLSVEFQTAKSAGSKITAAVPMVKDYTLDIQKIKELMMVKIEEPKLTEREQKLLNMAKSGKQSMLTEMKTEFSTDTNICPFCLQDISDEYKRDLILGIEKVLSKVAEEHETALQESKVKIIAIDLSPFEIIDKAYTSKCKNAIEVLSSKITDCNATIERKINNLYVPITDFASELQEAAQSLKEALKDLDDKKKVYNERSSRVIALQNELKKLNKKLAYFEIKDTYADFLKQKSEKELAKRNLDELTATLEKAKKELADLNQQKENVKIAVKFINNGLKYVFFSENRLSVEPRDGNYILKSNDKEVKPKNISVGERNILSLCYFFTEILSNVDEKDVHKSECMIVLDDPVSSFDLENRVGIISFLKSQIIKVLRGNINSKIILFSHDLLTIYDIDKALNEIKRQITVKIKESDEKMGYHLYTLDNRKISDFSRDNRNEYSQLLKTVYNYASGRSADYELVIGNIMRRMVEAFGTFEYRKGIEEIYYDPKILSIIPEEQRDYFENLMYRLVLHGESHLEERAKSQTDNNFFATITSKEKKRTAKDILCLMFLLNGNHIKSQFYALKDEVGNDVIPDIEKWLAAIIPADENEVEQ